MAAAENRSENQGVALEYPKADADAAPELYVPLDRETTHPVTGLVYKVGPSPNLYRASGQRPSI
jgi:hypothetical protein